MPSARIYQPAKTAMQSGKAKDRWLLEWLPDRPYFTETLMGWTGMSDTLRQLRLSFDSAEQAVAYAKERGLTYEVESPAPSGQIRKAYADNFSFSKIKA